MQKYTGVVIDAKGGPMTGVTVTVNVAGGSLASIFSDNGVTAKGNPFSNDANGSFEFYAANGRYDIVLAKAGVTFVAADLADIALFDGVARGVFFVCHITAAAGIAASNTVYMGPHGHEAIEANANVVMPFSGVLRNLRVRAGGSPGQTPGFTYTVFINGSASALAAVISGGATSASDLTNAPAVTVDQPTSVRLVTAAGANTVGGHTATFELI